MQTQQVVFGLFLTKFLTLKFSKIKAMKFAISLQIMNQNQICKLVGVFFIFSSNPSKNYFLHAVAKHKVLTVVPSKNIVTVSKRHKVFKGLFRESLDYAKPLLKYHIRRGQLY